MKKLIVIFASLWGMFVLPAATHVVAKKKAAQKKSQPKTLIQQTPVLLADYFHPTHTLPGIGLGRLHISDNDLQIRVQRQIDAQTFGILRDKRALLWAKRVTDPDLQKLFVKAAHETGFSKELLEGLVFIESGADPQAKSPTGPLGLMQFAAATAKRVGLKIYYELRFKLIPGKNKGAEPKKVPYQFLVDERLDPEKSLMAAAKFLAKLKAQYGREDLALWAYHSGERYPNKAVALARSYGMQNPGVPEIFFNNSPVHNIGLYNLIAWDMKKDFGSTYYFRVKRAAELIDLYRNKPDSYKNAFEAYQNRVEPEVRAPNRLFIWYALSDIRFQTRDDLKSASGKTLFPVPQNPLLSFELRTSGLGAIGEMDPEHRSLYLQAPQEVTGMLEYVAYETRRLWDALDKKKGGFVPLPVTALIRDLVYQEKLRTVNANASANFPTHTIGAVDISYLKLPSAELECLKFVIEDMGWDEYLSYYEESKTQKTFHLGPAPSQIDFFRSVYDDAQKVSRATKN